MNRKSFLWAIFFAIALALVLLIPRVVMSQEQQAIAECVNNARMEMNSEMSNEEVRNIQLLFANHKLIKRSVEEIPDGIQAVTESNNPRVAALIQEHVADMYKRMEKGEAFSMISKSLPIMFNNASLFKRQVENTSKGVIINEKSFDSNLTPILRDHAHEVTNLLARGIAGLCADRMKAQ